MRSRRREIDVFSMSALDLFASGMGTFIILAVVAMPFFPKTGDSAARLEELEARLEEALEQSRELEQALAQARIKDTELEELLEQANQRSRELEEALANASTDDEDLAALLEEANARSQRLEEALAKAQTTDGILEALLAEANERSRQLEEALAQARERDNDLEQRLEEANARSQELEEALAKAVMTDLDLVLCLDVSGSMSYQIDGLKREIGVLARILDSLAPSAGVGVVAFGDRMWSRPIRAHGIVETTNLDSLLTFVNSLTPNMNDPQANLNADGPEALATALEHAVDSDWRTSSERQFIIVISDNAAYPERRAGAVRSAQDFSSREGRHVSTVRANFTEDPGDRRAADRFLRQLADAGGGQFVDAAGGESMIGSLLLAILAI